MLMLFETETWMWFGGVSSGWCADGGGARGGWGDEDGVGQGWTRWDDLRVMEALMARG